MGLGFVWLIASGVASGQSPPLQEGVVVAEAVTIGLWTVQASNKDSSLDPRLSLIGKHLKRIDYTAFELISQQDAEMLVEDRKGFQLVSGHTVQVSMLSFDDERARVRVRIAEAAREILDTTVSIQRNSFFMVAGPRHGDGVLVLPIFARY